MAASLHGFGRALTTGTVENAHDKILGNSRLMLWAADEALSWNKLAEGPKYLAGAKVKPVKDAIVSAGSFLDGPYDFICYAVDTIQSVLSLFADAEKALIEKVSELAQNIMGVIATGAKTLLFLNKQRSVKVDENAITPLKITACSASIVKSSIGIGRTLSFSAKDEEVTEDPIIASARLGKKVLEVARSVSSIALQALCILSFVGAITVPTAVFLTLTSTMLVLTLAIKVLNTTEKPKTVGSQ